MGAGLRAVTASGDLPSPARRNRRLAAGLAAVSAVEVIIGLILAAEGEGSFTIGLEPASIGLLGSVILFPAVGALILQSRPMARVPWFMVATGVGLGLGVVLAGYGLTGLPPAEPRPFADLAYVVSQALFVPSLAAGTALLLLHFPTDELPDRRWRAVEWLAIGGSVIFAIGALFHSGPLDTELLPDVVNPLAAPAAIAPYVNAFITIGNTAVTSAAALGALSVVLRYRRADRIEAAQIRWLALVAGLAAPAFAIAALQQEPISGVAFGIGVLLLALMPVAIGFAITRYRLYEIDRLINRTFVYGSLTAILAGIFTAGIGLAQRLFVNLTGSTSDAAIVITTLVVATLYAPLRKRLEGIVDRRFKYDESRFGAYRTELQQHLSLVEAEKAAERLAAEAVRELAAVGAAVLDADGTPIATADQWPVSAEVRLPIPGARGRLRTVVVGPRTDGLPHDPIAVATLEELAALAAAAAG